MTTNKLILLILHEETGKRFSFTVNPLLFKTTAAFLCVLVCLSVTFVFGYLYLLQKNFSYKNTLNSLQAAIKRLETEKKESEGYRHWADSVIFKRLNFEETMGTGSGVKAGTAAEDAQAKKQDSIRELLAIEDFDITRINLALDFDCSFKLVNRGSSKSKLSGYLFIIASNVDTVPSVFQSWPKEEFLNGMPRDFHNGSTFDIRYHKFVKGRINQSDFGTKFNRLDVLAYAQDGTLLLKKGFNIEGLLQESPYE